MQATLRKWLSETVTVTYDGIQKTVLLHTAKILRKVFQIKGNFLLDLKNIVPLQWQCYVTS